MNQPEEEGSTADPLAEGIVVVLNRPGDVVNIATTLRAMMNMGLKRLRLVAPDEFSAYRVAGIAHGSEALIDRIEFFDTLDEALADVGTVIGTTARRRTAMYLWGYPRQEAPRLVERATSSTRPVALVFGREDTGLLNEDLDKCDMLLVVPTDPEHSSLNLAQAVLLICYELRQAHEAALAATPLPLPKRLPRHADTDWAEMQRMFDDWKLALETIDFFKTRSPDQIMRSLRATLRRAAPNEREVKLLRAIGIEVRKYVARLKSGGGG
jgi:tRNA (cytidine32/uridine32-2'-O)-methyltransferase